MVYVLSQTGRIECYCDDTLQHMAFEMGSDQSQRAVTMTLTRYREPDWLVCETLESLARQREISGDVLFFDQNYDADFAETVEAHSSTAITFKCIPCEEKSLSYARNKALATARHDIVLFIDCDAIADPGWAKHLTDALEGEEISIAGARILPLWRGRPPVLAKANVVLDQYSILDWGEEVKVASRVVGAGFGLNMRRFRDEIYFDEMLGRREGKLFGGEETDLCARLEKAGGRIVYCGKAVVQHQILSERLTVAWVLRRLYYAGLGRAQRGGAPAPSRAPGFWDWALLPVILPPYAAGYLNAKFRSLSS